VQERLPGDGLHSGGVGGQERLGEQLGQPVDLQRVAGGGEGVEEPLDLAVEGQLGHGGSYGSWWSEEVGEPVQQRRGGGELAALGSGVARPPRLAPCGR
jgi:hypothetical protein